MQFVTPTVVLIVTMCFCVSPLAGYGNKHNVKKGVYKVDMTGGDTINVSYKINGDISKIRAKGGNRLRQMGYEPVDIVYDLSNGSNVMVIGGRGKKNRFCFFTTAPKDGASLESGSNTKISMNEMSSIVYDARSDPIKHTEAKKLLTSSCKEVKKMCRRKKLVKLDVLKEGEDLTDTKTFTIIGLKSTFELVVKDPRTKRNGGKNNGGKNNGGKNNSGKGNNGEKHGEEGNDPKGNGWRGNSGK